MLLSHLRDDVINPTCTYTCMQLKSTFIYLHLQVNHSPSFHTDAPLDKEVKEGLLHDTFNLIDLYANDKKKCQEEDRRRVKERLLCRQKPKDSTTREDDTREKYEVHLEAYERSHVGGFRRIYPQGNEAEYAKYFDQSTSLCAETAASRARTDLARQHKEEIEAKQKEREEFRRKLSQGFNAGKERGGKDDELRAESPRSYGVEKRHSGGSVQTLSFKRRGTNFRLPLYSAGKRREQQSELEEEEVCNIQQLNMPNGRDYFLSSLISKNFHMERGFPLYESVMKKNWNVWLVYS